MMTNIPKNNFHALWTCKSGGALKLEERELEESNKSASSAKDTCALSSRIPEVQVLNHLTGSPPSET